MTRDSTNNGDDWENIEKDDIGQKNSELFDDSDDELISTNDSIVAGRNIDIKMGSGSKRKAESGDDETEDGKKQRSDNQI